MKKINLLVSAAAILICTCAGAQALSSSYFLDRSFQRTELNPAFAPEDGYVSLPVISGIGTGANANFGIDDFLFNVDGVTYTFLNKRVPYETFAAGLIGDPTVSADFSARLLGVGVKIGKRGYLTVNADLMVSADVTVPRQLLLFAKAAMPSSSTEYNFKNLAVSQISYVKAGVGYSYDFEDLVPGLKAGARINYIALGDLVDVRFNNAAISMSADKWTVNTDATGIAVAKGVSMDMTDKKFNPTFDGPYGLAGGGVTFELGAEYKLKLDIPVISAVDFSASISNLGFVSASGANVTKFVSAGEAEYRGFTEITPDTDFGKALDNIAADFENLLNLRQVTDPGSYTHSFKPVIFVGADVQMFSNRLSAGLLYNNQYGFSEMSVSLNAKLKAFQFSVNYSFLTSNALGFYIGVVPKSGLSFFIGSDFIPTRFTPQYIPMNPNGNVKLGISIVL